MRRKKNVKTIVHKRDGQWVRSTYKDRIGTLQPASVRFIPAVRPPGHRIRPPAPRRRDNT